MRKLTMQLIAEAANVSCATVSRCLSGREGVGEKTRERVLRICRDMGYNPNFTESAPHRSGRLGLVLPTLRDPEAARLAAELEGYLSGLGYGLVLGQSGGRQQEKEAVQRMAAQRVDGVILIPAGREARRQVSSEGETPLVYLGAHLGDQPESYVAVDHFLGGQAAVRHLHSLGHQRILFLPGGEPEICRRRRSGYESACKQLKLKIPEGLEDCTAVIAAHSGTALEVPKGLSLVSFDGEAFDLAGIPISTFDSPENMARIAADILLEQLERPIGGYSHRMVVPQLKRRGSDILLDKEVRHG